MRVCEECKQPVEMPDAEEAMFARYEKARGKPFRAFHKDCLQRYSDRKAANFAGRGLVSLAEVERAS